MTPLRSRRSTTDVLIFHVATDSDWQVARATGTYTTATLGVSLEQEGFIHMSRDSQVPGVLARYYAAVTVPLTLLTVDTDLLAAPWRLDDVPGAEQSFPHIYGPLGMAAVVDATPLTHDAAGAWQLPTLPAST